MKISTLLICIVLFCGFFQVKSQSLAPSTVRQVFNFAQGDSLEYHIWTVANGCGTICDWYKLRIVDSIIFNNAQDTLFIFFQTQPLDFDSLPVPINPCGQCSDFFWSDNVCALTASTWTIFNLDSSIISYMDSVNGRGYATDSIYINDTSYNGNKQNAYSFTGNGFDGCHDIYADSLGIVYKADNQELADNDREQLIYYHKANGSTWGAPYISTGIETAQIANDIAVYPNPVTDKFIIHSGQFHGLHFDLFDVLSKRVITLNLTGTEIEVSRNNLPPGIYFWQTSNGTNSAKSGVLVLE